MEYFFINHNGRIQYYVTESGMELEVIINGMREGILSQPGMWSKAVYLAAKKGIVEQAASSGLFGIKLVGDKPENTVKNDLLCCY